MPKTIAEERIKLVCLTTKPADVSKPTTSELAAGVDLSMKVLFSDFRLSPVASDTLNEPALGEGGNSSVAGKANYEGNLSVFRFLDDDGVPIAGEDDGWDLLKVKGSDLHFYKRIGPKHTEPFAAGQDVEYYHAQTDNPQDPQDLAGYIKKTIPLLVQGDSDIHASVSEA